GFIVSEPVHRDDGAGLQDSGRNPAALVGIGRLKDNGRPRRGALQVFDHKVYLAILDPVEIPDNDDSPTGHHGQHVSCIDRGRRPRRTAERRSLAGPRKYGDVKGSRSFIDGFVEKFEGAVVPVVFLAGKQVERFNLARLYLLLEPVKV